MHLQRTVHIIKTGNASYIVISYYNTGDRLIYNTFAVIIKINITIVVSGNTAGIIRRRLPVIYNFPENGAVVVREIAGTVMNGSCSGSVRTFFTGPHFPVCPGDAAHIVLIACHHTVIDAVCNSSCRVMSYDTSHIGLTNDIADIGSGLHCSGSMYGTVLIQGTDDAAYFFFSQDVAILLSAAISENSSTSIADDAAHIFTFQQVLFAGVIRKVLCPAGCGSGGIHDCLVRITCNTAKIMTFCSGIRNLCRTQNQSVTGAVLQYCFGIVRRLHFSQPLNAEISHDTAGILITGDSCMVLCLLNNRRCICCTALQPCISDDAADTGEHGIFSCIFII